MATQEFTRNFTDHSNDLGFQFEFHCDKCGNGVRSSFVANKAGVAVSLMGAASSLFGGFLGSAANAGRQMKDMLRGPAWDSAFAEAAAECRPRFRQCNRCGLWVCPEICFNHDRGLCQNCAPDLEKEAAAAQAHVAVAQVQERVQKIDQTGGFDANAHRTAACPHCGAPAGAGKFCPACGQSLAVDAPCAKCGAMVAAAAKFCPECGAHK
jgi:RNA polymerase subunit RPABC4/transcription elongation factor Spt4